MDRTDRSARCRPQRRWPTAVLGMLLLGACGAGGTGNPAPAVDQPAAGSASSAVDAAPPGTATPGGAAGSTASSTPRVLPPPVLSFTDTGISVSDGLTSNGKWRVAALLDGLGWEYSLDMGRTWIRGEGDGFEVTGDGRRTLWVRSFDPQGNTSEIVVVSCTLDTVAPAAPQVVALAGAALPTIVVDGLEPMATWEYSVDDQRNWVRGAGASLTPAGNGVRRIWWRQVDAAGNPSMASSTRLDEPASPGWFEPSAEALAPTALPAWEATLLLHGEISRPDMDFVSFEVPPGRRLRSLRLVHYESVDPIAFYALQRGPAFDAGTNVQRMLSWKHLGPSDRFVELLAAVPADERGPGIYTLWMNQTGVDRTAYAIEIGIGPP